MAIARMRRRGRILISRAIQIGKCKSAIADGTAHAIAFEEVAVIRFMRGNAEKCLGQMVQIGPNE